MIIEISNCINVMPFAETLNLTLPVMNLEGRNANVLTTPANGQTYFNLGWTPTHPSWVEVYIDGFRVVNLTHDFGETYNRYTISGTTITFNTPVYGELVCICDRDICNPYDLGQVIKIDNEQGAEVNTILPAGSYYAALFCEPIILTQPIHGYVRMSDDRQNLVYYPDPGYEGGDAFSYTVVTSRGQIATPKCVYITMVVPTPPEEEESEEP